MDNALVQEQWYSFAPVQCMHVFVCHATPWRCARTHARTYTHTDTESVRAHCQ
jgi:hypothetical protein